VKIYRDIDSLTPIRNAVVTTGSFDGVHIGHQVLINRLNELARSVEGESVLITFYPHVRKVLYPATVGKSLQMINTQSEKIELLEKAGLDNLVIVNFTLEFAKTSAEDFVRHLLVGKLHAKVVVVGYNHYFGHNKEGNYDKLMALGRELEFTVVEIPRQDLENETVGSTRIRQSLSDGKIMHANAYLDHIYFIDTHFCSGSPLFAQAGFETFAVKIEEDSKLIPPDGIYAVRIQSNGNNTKGMMLNNYHGTLQHPLLNQDVEVMPFEKLEDFCEKCGKVFVHRELSQNMPLQDINKLRTFLNQLRELIDEMIY
jgi:riboflavin kinase/FMN adenylyltransferase